MNLEEVIKIKIEVPCIRETEVQINCMIIRERIEAYTLERRWENVIKIVVITQITLLTPWATTWIDDLCENIHYQALALGVNGQISGMISRDQLIHCGLRLCQPLYPQGHSERTKFNLSGGTGWCIWPPRLCLKAEHFLQQVVEKKVRESVKGVGGHTSEVLGGLPEGESPSALWWVVGVCFCVWLLVP